MGEDDKNLIYIINGETTMVIAALKKNTKWSMLQHQDDTNNVTLKDFAKLKETLKNITNIIDIKQNVYLDPFLKTISCEDTTGPVTRLALSSLQKFIQYNMIALDSPDSLQTIESIAHSLIHAKFIGTDPAADEVVIQKILQVMQTLFFSKLGPYLTDQSVCGILHSFFRIAFEMRFADLLRHYSENALIEIFLVILDHIPTMIKKNTTLTLSTPQLCASSKSIDQVNETIEDCINQEGQPIVESSQNTCVRNLNSESTIVNQFSELDLAKCYTDTGQYAPDSPDLSQTLQEPPVSYDGLIVKETLAENEEGELRNEGSGQTPVIPPYAIDMETRSGSLTPQPAEAKGHPAAPAQFDENSRTETEDDVRINERGVMFRARSMSMAESNGEAKEASSHRPTLKPYGYSSLNELMRFILNLTNPSEKQINNDFKVVYALNLLVMAFERRPTEIAANTFVLRLIKDRLCKNIIELIKSEKLTIVAACLRLGFNLFKSLKHHLKYQMEMFLCRLMEIIASDCGGGTPGIPYQKREYILDLMVQFFKLPNFSADLYLNYDCDLYCSNLLEDWTKLLSKNAFPITGIYSVHLLSLEALFAIVDDISARCKIGAATTGSGHRSSLMPALKSDTCDLTSDSDGYKSGAFLGEGNEARRQSAYTSEANPSDEDKATCQTPRPDAKAPISIKMKKILLHTGTEHFNTKPSKGIQFLQEAGILAQPLNEVEMAHFLRENPGLDKKMVGEYLANRKNLGVLQAFVYSFNFDHTRIDQALRMYLEAFRLPGEAPLISLMLENFAHHWHVSNGEPFANEDAAFALAYGIIMLNVDQHHQIVKKQMNPMTVEEFTKNLSKVNGGDNFDPGMLKEIYKAIKSEEIVMPAEQTGTVKDNYLWKLLLRRGESRDYHYQNVFDGSCDSDIFMIVWGPTVAASSYVFDKSSEEIVTNKIMTGFKKCALVANHFALSDVLDKLVITLCKFTNVINMTENIENLPVTLGNSPKALLSLRMVFLFARYHGDILAEGWKYIVDMLFQLFRARLLPDMYVEVDDYLSPTCKISLHRALRHQNLSSSGGGEDGLALADYRARFYFTANRSNAAAGWGSLRNRNRKKGTGSETGTGSGLFSSFYSYVFSGPTGPDSSPNANGPTDFFGGPGKEYSPAERAAAKNARDCVLECTPENVVWDSKFLSLPSLKELFKTLMYSTDKFAEPTCAFDFDSLYSSPNAGAPGSVLSGGQLDSGSDATREELDGSRSGSYLGTWPGVPTSIVMDPVHEDYLVFNLELLVQIIIQNRDRINLVWSSVRSYFYDVIVNNSAPASSAGGRGGSMAGSQPGKRPAAHGRTRKPAPNATFMRSKASSMPTSSAPAGSARPDSLAFGGHETTGRQGYFSEFLLERAVVGLLRIATRLARRSSIVSRVIGSLRILLMFVNDPVPSLATPRFASPQSPGQLKGNHQAPTSGHCTNLNFYFERFLSPHAACGLAELVRLNCPSGNIRRPTDWAVILACLERVGACAFPVFYSANASTTSAITGTSFKTNTFGEMSQPPGKGSSREDLVALRENLVSKTDVAIEDSGFASNDGAATSRELTVARSLSRTDSLGRSNDDWLIVKNQDVLIANPSSEGEEPPRSTNPAPASPRHHQGPADLSPCNQLDYVGTPTVVKVRLKPHNPFSFAKCCDTLSFVVTGHLTPVNFHLALAAVSTFAEAYVRGRRINSNKFQRAGVAANTERSPILCGSVMEYLLSCEKSVSSAPLGPAQASAQPGAAGDKSVPDACDIPGGIVTFYEGRHQPNPFASFTFVPEPKDEDHKQTGYKNSQSHRAKKQKSILTGTQPSVGGEEDEGEAEDNLEDEDDTYGPQGEGSSDSGHALPPDPSTFKGNKPNRVKSAESVAVNNDKATAASFFGRRKASPNLVQEGIDDVDSQRQAAFHKSDQSSAKGTRRPHEGYRDIYFQILDTMYAMQTQAKPILYESDQFTPSKLTRANQASDYADWISNFLWPTVWRPLLKGMARMCCDRRRQVRMTALTYLQRSLLAADLQELSGSDWENCFSEVLFPLMSHLLNNDTRPRLPAKDFSGLEETRHRAATLLSKVFLQHLSLLSPPGPKGTGCSALFTSLWLSILDYMDRFVHASGDNNDMLAEAIPESLKNMLLVMDTSGIFQQDPGLRELTWDRINSFLPKILLEIRFQQEQLTVPPTPPPPAPFSGNYEGQGVPDQPQAYLPPPTDGCVSLEYNVDAPSNYASQYPGYALANPHTTPYYATQYEGASNPLQHMLPQQQAYAPPYRLGPVQGYIPDNGQGLYYPQNYGPYPYSNNNNQASYPTSAQQPAQNSNGGAEMSQPSSVIQAGISRAQTPLVGQEQV